MNFFISYLDEIENRKKQKLSPKPIEDDRLMAEIITQIKDPLNSHRKKCLNFLIYNTLPGTAKAAGLKAHFLKEIISTPWEHQLFFNIFCKKSSAHVRKIIIC